MKLSKSVCTLHRASQTLPHSVSAFKSAISFDRKYQNCTSFRAYVASRWSEDALQSAGTVNVANKEIGLHVNSHFDSGNIEVISVADGQDIRLAIHKDPYCDTDKTSHFQWFYYRITGVKNRPLVMRITNAGQASYPSAWNGYEACASADLETWIRVPTSFDPASGELTIRHTPAYDSMHYAYFAPYTYERHTQLVHRMQVKEHVQLRVLSETLDGHDLDLLQIGQPGPGKRSVWVLARQHPGEPQGEWAMEGLLERLTDPHDPVGRWLQQHAVVYAVPNMNPDGTWRGHLRCNAAGVNLNRAWLQPSVETSPEVAATLTMMEQTGVDLLLDLHADEELPHVFMAGNEGIPAWDGRLKDLQERFVRALLGVAPEFQTKMGYAVSAPGAANMSLCSKQVGQRFNCLALTVEMPFKDCKDLPDPVYGWSPQRCKRLGAGLLSAVQQVLPHLRT